MNFSVDLRNSLAVYTQIENQILFAIASGVIQEGELIPSARTVSDMVDVDPTTVNKAFRDLEILGLVTIRRGIGVIVNTGARKIAKNRMLPVVRRHVESAVAECLACGMKGSEVLAVAGSALVSGAPPYGRAKLKKADLGQGVSSDSYKRSR